MALVHDLAESIVGDLTPSCGVSKEEKRKREEVSSRHSHTHGARARIDFVRGRVARRHDLFGDILMEMNIRRFNFCGRK